MMNKLMAKYNQTKNNIICILFFCCLTFSIKAQNVLTSTVQTVAFTAPGAHSWTVPACVSTITVGTWGAGGGGATGGCLGSPDGTGGAGGAYSAAVLSVVQGQTYSLSVGAGGSGAIWVQTSNCLGIKGGNGQGSWFANSSTVYAQGGSGGIGSNQPGYGSNSIGGQASTGYGNLEKRSGGGGECPGTNCLWAAGGGGSSAGSGYNGNTAPDVTAVYNNSVQACSGGPNFNSTIPGGIAPPTEAGAGGVGGYSGPNISGFCKNNTGANMPGNGGFPGGGGGGGTNACNSDGAAGGNGQVKIWYSPQTPTAICKEITVQLDSNGVADITPQEVDAGSYATCGIASLSLDKTSYTCSNIGNNTVILTVTDVNGNTSSCNATVTVQDNVAPTMVFTNITVQLDSNGLASIVASDIDGGSTDNCSIASLTIDKSAFSRSNLGLNIVALTATDAAGNAATCNATVTIVDSLLPAITCPGDIYIQANSDDCSPIVNWDEPLVSDSSFTLTSNHQSGDRFNIGTTTVTYTVTDGSNNTSTCSFNIIVEPGPFGIAGIAGQLYPNGYNVSGKGKKDGFVSMNVVGGCLPYSYTWSTIPVQSGTTTQPYGVRAYGLGAGTFTVIITDANGTTIGTTATITEPDSLAADTVPPIAVCKNITVQLDTNGTAYISAVDVDGGSTDDVGITSLTIDKSAFSRSNLGLNTVALTATDAAGNAATCNATVTIVDSLLPAITCPGDIYIQANSDDCSPIVNWDEPLVSDSSFTLTSNHQSGDRFNIGTTTITYTVTDGSNNTSTCSFNIIVEPAPFGIAGIAGQLYPNGYNVSGKGKKDGFVSMNVVGGCLPYSYTWSTIPVQSGTTTQPYGVRAYGLGAGTFTVIITDANGTTIGTTATITEPDSLAADTVPPIAVCKNITVQLDSNGVADITPQDIDSASYANGGIASMSVTPSHFTCNDVGHRNAYLSVTDSSGNVSYCTANVDVVASGFFYSIAKKMYPNGYNVSKNGGADGEASFIAKGAGCPISYVWHTTPEQFTATAVGLSAGTYVLDFYYSNFSQSLNITISEPPLALPTAICKEITVQLDSNGVADITPQDVDNGSFADGGIASMNVTPSHFTCANTGNNIVMLTVTDSSGNVSTCSATVVVKDTIAPVAVCKNVTVQLDSNGVASIVASDVNGGSTDNCSIDSMTIDKTNFTCANIGNNVVKLTVKDVHGYVSTCNAIVTVTGSVPTVSITQSNLPEFCQGNSIVLTATSNSNVTYLWSGGTTSNILNVSASGTYSVVATNQYGCSASSSTTVNYDASNLLSNYTILTKNDSLSSNSKLLAGGLGITKKNGTAIITSGSTVTAPGTFVKSRNITISGGGAVATIISEMADVALPIFKTNLYSQGSALNVNVSANGNVVINDSIFKTITIGNGAKVTFTAPVIYATSITMNNSSSIEFEASCPKVSIKGEFTMNNNCSVNNTNGKSVVFYITKDLTMGHGTNLKASVYTKGNIYSNGTVSNLNNLTGLFIADGVGSRHTNFNWNSVCGNCSLVTRSEIEYAANKTENNLETSNGVVNVYPNPSTGNFNVTVNSDKLGKVIITVFTLTGQTILQTTAQNTDGWLQLPVDLSEYTGGIYFLKIQVGDEQFTKKIILSK